MEDDKKRFPDRMMYIAEAFPYYTGRHNSIRDYNPVNSWYVVKNNDFIFGQFVWAVVDYLGESSGWPSKGWRHVYLMGVRKAQGGISQGCLE
jgi:beta-galactosidase